MENPWHLLTYWWVPAVLMALVLYRKILRLLFGIVMIQEDSLGIVNKKFAILGKHTTLPDGAIMALKGEAGIQADTLAPGVHFGFWAWQYEVVEKPFTNIPQGKIGVVESRDGAPIGNGRVLARKVDCSSFQDARAFLANDGQRGPQIAIVPPGTYRINTELFTITLYDVTDISDNMVGVVTTKEGSPLPTGEIAGNEVPGHNLFQDAQAFIEGGGTKGLQEQVILSGRYYINPLFATVDERPMSEVPIAHVGVVIAFVGKEGRDVTGDTFKHGNLVSKGEKGVWAEPLDPGKYPINPFTHKLECVPTANVVLNWATGKTEAHKLDENLSTITVRSSDGFTFNLDVSQIIHIPRNDAPRVIARFGSVANLVTQVLEPTIGNYFRNAAQGSDVIEFLKLRSQRQEEARASIGKALAEYNVGAVDTLIGDITPPDALMKTLTDRKTAEQEKLTYETQRLAEVERQQLQQARALADTQAKVVDSERKVQIAEFDAQSAVKQAEGASKAKIIAARAEAENKIINAKADAEVFTTTGTAEAAKIKAVGEAEAEVIQKKTSAIGQDNYALIEVGCALAAAKIPLVPQVVAGGNGSGHGTLVDVLLAGLVKDKLGGNLSSDGEGKAPTPVINKLGAKLAAD